MAGCNCGSVSDAHSITCAISTGSKSLGPLLTERGVTHGDYRKMASTIQCIKVVMRDGHSWPLLTPGQQEALELIATKIGRIVEGDPNYHDHWADLSGYATKGLESCR